MSAQKIGMDRLQELVRLHRMGASRRRIARLLRMSVNTQRPYRLALAAEGLLDGPPDALPALDVLRAAVEKHASPQATPEQQVSSIVAWRPRIEEWLVDKKLTPRTIYDRLRLEHKDQFKGTLSAVKRLCRRIRRDRGVRPEDVAIPVETGPGEIAQVDFGYVGKLYDAARGLLRKAWVFVLVLCYSRHLFARIVFDQKVETWLQLHVEAFAEIGGVVETVVPDNLKSAVVRAAFGADRDGVALNRSYRELARHYGFAIDPAPPYAPRKKGKVESGVKYVKRSFFAGRDGADVDIVRPELQRWVYEIAGTREHGTTGKRPLEVFEEIEREALRPLPTAPFEVIVWKEATVHRDSHVAFDKRLYSVPWRLIGQKVWVRAAPASIVVFASDERVATHDRQGSRPRSTIDAHLPEHRVDLRHRSRTYWEERADAIGSETGAHVREVFDSNDVLCMLRTVQAIVTHLETFPRERAEAACRRARTFGNHTYQGIKMILRRALDLQPLPSAGGTCAAWSKPPRFARDLKQLVLFHKEENDDAKG